MSFLYSSYALPLGLVMIALLVTILIFDSRYYEWIKQHWFLKRSIASKISSFLFCSGLLVLSVILLDPREKEIKIKTPVKKSKTIILIDTSTSMLVEDVRPNRLERATLLAKHFARRAAHHQISIMIFADVTKKLVPFTNDRDLIDARIDSVKEVRNLNAGTSVEKAIAEAARTFGSSDKNTSGNILVITDGEDHSERIDIEVPENVKVALLGVGTPEGGNIPLKDSRGMFYGYKKDRAQTVISKLDKKYFTQAVSGSKNKKYFEASITGIPSDEIYSFFSSTDGALVNEENSIRPVGIKRFAYPGLVLILLGLVARLLPQMGVIILLLAIDGRASEVPPEINNRLELLKNGKLTREEKINLADNLVKHKMHKVANEIYAEQMSDADAEKFSESYFNWATSILEEKKIKEAIQKYSVIEKSRKADPQVVGKIRENIKRALQKAQDEKNKENKKKDKDKKDQDKQDQKEKSESGESNPSESDQQEGDGKQGESSDGSKNNPFDLKPNEEKKSEEGESPKEKENTEKKQEIGDKPSEAQPGKETKAASPLLEQLKQDDRKLQIKLLDTSTQGNHDAKKKDW